MCAATNESRERDGLLWYQRLAALVALVITPPTRSRPMNTVTTHCGHPASIGAANKCHASNAMHTNDPASSARSSVRDLPGPMNRSSDPFHPGGVAGMVQSTSALIGLPPQSFQQTPHDRRRLHAFL